MKAGFFKAVMKIRNVGIEIAVLAVMAGILCSTLLFRPLVGMADNGDFYRVMQPMGLRYLPQDYNDRHFGYFIHLYEIAQRNVQNIGSFISTQEIPIKIALWVNSLFGQGHIFDIRFLAVIYSVIFLLSIYLIMRCTARERLLQRLIMAALLVLIFLDVGYMAYFNSLYGEPASFTFLFLTLSSLLLLAKQSKPKVIHLLLFTASAVMLTGAKQQNSPLGILLALMSLRYIAVRKDRKWKTAVIGSCTVLLMTSAVIFCSISEEIRVINQYHTITLGILKGSPDPGRDLEELGIDRKYLILAGTTYFDRYHVIDPRSPEMKKEFYSKCSFSKIAEFYIRHPGRFADKMEITARKAFTIRPQAMGNYEKAEGLKFGQKARAFSAWSSFKQNVMPHSLSFIIVFYLVFTLICIFLYLKSRRQQDRMRLEILILVQAIGLAQFVTPIIGAGEADLAKHLFLFDVCFDIIFVAYPVILSGLILKFISGFKMSSVIKGMI